MGNESGRPNNQEQTPVDYALVFDIAARFNESIAANVDAIDNALIAVLVGDFVTAIFLIDKMRELAGNLENAAIILLAISAFGGLSGYLIGTPLSGPRLAARDGSLPRDLIIDLEFDAETALEGAVNALVLAGESNLLVRTLKRTLAIASIIALIGGTICVALARSQAKVL